MNTQKKETGAFNQKAWKVYMTVWSLYMMILGNPMLVSASADYGKKAGTWLLDQIFWVGLVALAIALIGCLVKKAWVAAVITFICGGLVLFFIKDPNKAVDIATNIYTSIFW